MAKPNLRLPFLKKYRDRHGKLRFYHRPTGTALPGKPGSPEFMAAYHAACGHTEQPVLTFVKRTPRLRTDAEGSIDWLVTKYYNSDQWKRLSVDTQNGRRRMLERFRADHGDKPIDSLQAIHIKALMDEITGGAHPKRNWLKHLSGMFLFAEEEMIRVDNPCRGFKRPTPPKTDGFHSWTDGEIAQYRGFWRYGTVPRLVMELAVETSARRGDVTRLGPEQMASGRFEFQHHKNGVDVSFPVSAELQAAIDAMPKTNQPTFVHTKAGNARSAKALGNDFREWCDQAKLPKRCSLHGLRKGCLRILAEAGCNILELQSRSGHLTLSELQKYIDAADKRFAADRAAEKVIEHKAKQKTARKIAA
jgi:integrase-like protein